MRVGIAVVAPLLSGSHHRRWVDNAATRQGAPSPAFLAALAPRGRRLTVVTAAAACQPADEAPVIRPGVLSQDSRTALKGAYEGAQPFPHSAIHDLCDPQLLRQV